jgi:hypothetical protein
MTKQTEKIKQSVLKEIKFYEGYWTADEFDPDHPEKPVVNLQFRLCDGCFVSPHFVVDKEDVVKAIDLAISKTQHEFMKEESNRVCWQGVYDEAYNKAIQEVFAEQYVWLLKLQTYVEKCVKKLEAEWKKDPENSQLEIEVRKEQARLLLIYASSLEWKAQAKKFGLTEKDWKDKKFGVKP